MALSIQLLVNSQSVPNTTTFTLQNVVDAVNPTTDDLIDCFNDANSTYFNSTYKTQYYADYGNRNNLLMFRDYGPHNALPPTVTTGSVTEYWTNAGVISTYGITFSGNVTSQGSTSVTERGFVWSTIDATPTIGESGVTKSVYSNSGTGAMTFSWIPNTTPGIAHYISAYAKNSIGTTYGNVTTFTTCIITPEFTTTLVIPYAYAYIVGGVTTDFHSTLAGAQDACHKFNLGTVTLLGYETYWQSGFAIWRAYQEGTGDKRCDQIGDGYYVLPDPAGTDHIIQVSGGYTISRQVCN